MTQGMKVVEVVDAIGTHEVPQYHCRKEYGGMKVTQLTQLKELGYGVS
ncbi:hypothetical protein ACFLS0_03890 [Candidatus Bipolaricaulota bacterium]